MSFDFYAEYKNYSNGELLMIIRQPDEYQPQAVAAATKILEERQVTEEEINWVDAALQDLAFAKKYESEKFGRLKAKTAEVFPPVFQPHETVEPSKWLNFLLLVIGIEYVWTLIGLAKKFDLWTLFPVLYLPVIFYLLFKRRRWGWILLFADNLGTLILLLSETYIFFKYQQFHHGDTVTFLSSILLRSAFAVFLWQEKITGLFGVTTTTKKRTALVTTAGILVYMGLYLVNH